MVNNQKYHYEDKKLSLDAIAEKWVNIVFAQIQAKKLATKKPIKINNKYEYATQ